MGVYGQIINETNYRFPVENLFNENYIPNCSYNVSISESYNVDTILEQYDGIFLEGLESINKLKGKLIDIKAITEESKRSAKTISEYIKENGFGKGTVDFITNELDRVANTIIKYINVTDIYALKFSNYDFNKIKSALILFVLTVAVNNIIALVLSILLAPMFTASPVLYSKLIQNLLVGILGPMNEEFAKRIAIKGGYVAEFTVVFNAFEISSYVKNISIMFAFSPLSTKTIVKNAFIARLKTATMHLSTTIIQYLMSNDKFAKKLGLNQAQAETVGNVIGVIIHSAWNLLAVNSKGFAKLILGKQLSQFV